MMFERILVPTDLSNFSLVALRCAETFAERFGSQITLLHANVFASSMYLDQPLGFYLESAPAPKRLLQERLRFMAHTHFAGATHVDTLVVDDEPAIAIVKAAADVDADLIIMATHGREGSITRRVMRMTSRPVLTVGAPSADEPRRHSHELQHVGG
jgi:nucleotide-binding universal stress UspA family protein